MADFNRYTFEGITDTAAGWAERLNLSERAFRERLASCKKRKDIFKPHQRKRILVTYKGETKNLKQWARHFKLPYSTVMFRYSKGYPVEKLFAKPRAKALPVKKPVKKKPVVTRPRAKSSDRPTKVRDDQVILKSADPDLHLKRFIDHWRGQGLSDNEILIKYRSAA